MNDANFDLTRKPIDKLGFTNDFNKQCKKMGFETLSDIFNLPEGAFFKLEGFSYLWLEELSEFLKEHELLYRL